MKHVFAIYQSTRQSESTHLYSRDNSAHVIGPLLYTWFIVGIKANEVHIFDIIFSLQQNKTTVRKQ